MLNVSEEQGRKYVELSHIALFAGKDASHRRLLGAFLSVAVRRRGLANIVDAVVKRTARLEIPTDLTAVGVSVADVALTTLREVINDFLNGLPYVEKYRSVLQWPIEAALKTLQKTAQQALPR